MIKTISNEYLKVKINTHGAEINSVQNSDGLEYIWFGDKKYWARHAPILFPIVGRLKDNQYTYDGKTYEMGQHGFARDMEFIVANQGEKWIDLQLVSNEETKKMYPFDFKLIIHYELNDHKLTTNINVYNTDTKEMYFSVGAHPAFNVPLVQDGSEQYDDYFVKFANKGEYDQIQFDVPYANLENIEKIELDQPIQLFPELFYDDAKVIEIKNREFTTTLSSDVSNHGVTMTGYNTEYGGIWSAKDAPFVCLEPWWGIADDIHTDGKIEHKVGINNISPNEKFVAKFDLSFF
ncbi:aldose 1-epimerase family protein [Apilactobacillus nanyangensis]|uniref:aldose 1-epimerase family protein n=1 Tax=Apilactobacillus nanyangensis TaxID=2799579 RepID=UPI0019420D9D|nr:aldose 1-epimerase family protein [Apilactobacillus nanyangensis]